MDHAYRKLRSELKKETKNFYRSMEFGRGRRLDDSYALADDVPLTQEEHDAVQEFWGRYSFAYPVIDFKSFQTFKNRTGQFDPRHLPGPIRSNLLDFSNPDYAVAFQNKAMLGMLYSEIPQPKTLFRRMNMLMYDEQYNHISLNTAIRRILQELKSQDLVFKLNFSCGGKGVMFLSRENTTRESLRQLITEEHPYEAFVIQAVLKQSEFMKAFNPSSVNTIRITTLLFKGKVHCLAALVRIGSPGSSVDNWHSGGSILNIDMETGKCQSWAMGQDMQRITQLPSGLDLSSADLVVPNFDRIKDMVVRQHYRIPYMRMVSWDIALDENDAPVMIELNFAGDLHVHEAVGGPAFGELTQAVCDEYILKRFFLKFAEKYFLCREYHDHVEIEAYLGFRRKENVTIPATLRDKPVTKVDDGAFKPGSPLVRKAKVILRRCPPLFRCARTVWRMLRKNRAAQ